MQSPEEKGCLHQGSGPLSTFLREAKPLLPQHRNPNPRPEPDPHPRMAALGSRLARSSARVQFAATPTGGTDRTQNLRLAQPRLGPGRGPGQQLPSLPPALPSSGHREEENSPWQLRTAVTATPPSTFGAEPCAAYRAHRKRLRAARSEEGR